MKIKTYSRSDLIKKISYKLNMNNEESRIILESVLDSFEDLLITDTDFDRSRIELRNFGIFDVYKTQERTNAWNPKTKESVIIPPRKKVVFKASKRIKNLLNKNTASRN